MKTVDEIYGELAAAFAGATGQTAGQDGDLAVRLYAVAAQVYALYVQADWTARQCFPQTAAGEYLDQHAFLRGLERKEAAQAVGVIRFHVDQAGGTDLTIPAGTVCMTAGLVRFETTEAAVLRAGSLYVDVPARAVEAGAAGNAAAGTILTMAVEQALRSWFNGGLLGQDVLRAKLGAVVFGVEGVENYDLTAPAEDVAVKQDELPKLGSLSVTEMKA